MLVRFWRAAWKVGFVDRCWGLGNSGLMIGQFGTAVDVSSWMEMIRLRKPILLCSLQGPASGKKWNYETGTEHVRSDWYGGLGQKDEVKYQRRVTICCITSVWSRIVNRQELWLSRPLILSRYILFGVNITAAWGREAYGGSALLRILFELSDQRRWDS